MIKTSSIAGLLGIHDDIAPFAMVTIETQCSCFQVGLVPCYPK